MTEATDKRAALIDRLADHILAEGLLSASLRPLAKAVGTSDRMLLYYFKDKDDLIAAVLDCIAARIMVLLDQASAPAPLPLDTLTPLLVTQVKSEQFWPYLRLWLEVAALSAGGDPLYKTCGARIGRGFVTWAAAQLTGDTPDQRQRDAAKLLIQVEGSVLLRSLGLDDVVDQAF